jgi:uncharacterized protein with GYD domain
MMPYFLVQASYSAEAAAHLVQHPQHREQALKKTCETLGGKLHAFYYCFGEYDAIALLELPDNRAAAAMSLSADASGALKNIKTTVLLTVAEAMDAMKQAQSDQYKPPA